MKDVPILVGPTAVGKTEISIYIAEILPVEIISADSRQIYQYLDIGTAKPDPQILAKIPHHFINSLKPETYYSAGIFASQARKVIREIFNRKKIPFVVGGAGFYIQALLDGLSEIAEVNGDLRQVLKTRWREEGYEKLFKELQRLDPTLARQLQPRDRQRILRGLEIYYSSGQKLSDIQKQHAEPAQFKSCIAGISSERNYLYKRINSRVDMMIEKGLVEEVKELAQRGYQKDLNALNTVGYKEVFDYLDNKISFKKMVEEIKINSRHYAKRQLTWFRRDDRIKWFNLNDYKNYREIAQTICSFYSEYLS
jgi:tRNA dimethylallyltransferase